MKNDILYLASASPRRQELLTAAGIPFEVSSHFFDEHSVGQNVTPADFATYVAMGKASSLSDHHEFDDRFILGVDTIVAFNGQILGKPENAIIAEQNIRRMSGQWHEVISGIGIVNRAKNIFCQTSCTSKVKFAELSDHFIDYYIRENHWRGFAGGYAIQQLFSLVVERIEGSYTNIVGLPMETLYTLLNEIGFVMDM